MNDEETWLEQVKFNQSIFLILNELVKNQHEVVSLLKEVVLQIRNTSNQSIEKGEIE